MKKKQSIKDEDNIVKRENLSEWIKKFEDHCAKNADIDEDVKEYVEYAMRSCKKQRINFHDKYLLNLDANLNVKSSKDNYSYHDFYRRPNPYSPFKKGLFKRGNEIEI